MMNISLFITISIITILGQNNKLYTNNNSVMYHDDDIMVTLLCDTQAHEKSSTKYLYSINNKTKEKNLLYTLNPYTPIPHCLNNMCAMNIVNRQTYYIYDDTIYFIRASIDVNATYLRIHYFNGNNMKLIFNCIIKRNKNQNN